VHHSPSYHLSASSFEFLTIQVGATPDVQLFDVKPPHFVPRKNIRCLLSPTGRAPQRPGGWLNGLVPPSAFFLWPLRMRWGGRRATSFSRSIIEGFAGRRPHLRKQAVHMHPGRRTSDQRRRCGGLSASKRRDRTPPGHLGRRSAGIWTLHAMLSGGMG